LQTCVFCCHSSANSSSSSSSSAAAPAVVRGAAAATIVWSDRALLLLHSLQVSLQAWLWTVLCCARSSWWGAARLFTLPFVWLAADGSAYACTPLLLLLLLLRCGVAVWHNISRLALLCWQVLLLRRWLWPLLRCLLLLLVVWAFWCMLCL
jgi:hypothetical protein